MKNLPMQLLRFNEGMLPSLHSQHEALGAVVSLNSQFFISDQKQLSGKKKQKYY